MFKRFKNAFKIVNFLSLALSTIFFILFTQYATVGATFDPFIDDGPRYQFTFINHSSFEISYDCTNATGGDHEIKGDVAPGETVEAEGFNPAVITLQQGSVPLIHVDGKPDPHFRFWSGNVQGDQYINALAGDGYEVKQDSSEISEITGNGLKVTVDGGGYDDPSTQEIYIQVYDY
jgi:hypothetical protein